jgi:hypothetical protein
MSTETVSSPKSSPVFSSEEIDEAVRIFTPIYGHLFVTHALERVVENDLALVEAIGSLDQETSSQRSSAGLFARSSRTTTRPSFSVRVETSAAPPRLWSEWRSWPGPPGRSSSGQGTRRGMQMPADAIILGVLGGIVLWCLLYALGVRP